MKNINILFLFLILLQAQFAFSNNYKNDNIYIVQDKVFHKYHELGAWIGYVPNDEFYLSYPAGINYVFHFNDLLSWEVFHLDFMINQEKDIKDNLIRNFGLAPKEISKPTYIIHSNFQFKPLYGKSSLFNKKVINHETYFLIGAGIIAYDKEYNYANNINQTAFSIDFGVGMRYFIYKNFSLNIELKDMLHFKDEQTENRMYLGLGLCFRFNLSPRKNEQDIRLDNLKKLLRDSNENEKN